MLGRFIAVACKMRSQAFQSLGQFIRPPKAQDEAPAALDAAVRVWGAYDLLVEQVMHPNPKGIAEWNYIAFETMLGCLLKAGFLAPNLT